MDIEAKFVAIEIIVSTDTDLSHLIKDIKSRPYTINARYIDPGDLSVTRASRSFLKSAKSWALSKFRFTRGN